MRGRPSLTCSLLEEEEALQQEHTQLEKDIQQDTADAKTGANSRLDASTSKKDGDSKLADANKLSQPDPNSKLDADAKLVPEPSSTLDADAKGSALDADAKGSALDADANKSSTLDPKRRESSRPRGKRPELENLSHLSATLRRRALGQLSVSVRLTSLQDGFAEDLLDWKFRFFKGFPGEWDEDSLGDEKREIEGPLLVSLNEAEWKELYIVVWWPLTAARVPVASLLPNARGA